MRKTKIIILLILLIGIGLAAIYKMPTPETSAAPEDFTRPDICLGQAIAEYHRTQNDLFNSRVALLTSGKPKTFVDKLPDVDLNSGQRKKCEDNNVTTFCLARLATQNYEAYLKVMQIHQGRLSDAVGNASTTPTIDQQLNALSNRQDLIKREIKNAKNALDLGLATYHEFRTAYPLHKKFEETYSKLEAYRDKVADVRRQVSTYQFKFIDVTTTQCQ